MIEYYYTYLTNKKFSLGTRNIYIYSVLEYALSKKSIIFYSSGNLVTNKKTARQRSKKCDSFVLIQARYIKKFLTRN